MAHYRSATCHLVELGRFLGTYRTLTLGGLEDQLGDASCPFTQQISEGNPFNSLSIKPLLLKLKT